MVTQIFNAQLKWFTWKLIEIRVQIEGYHTPIEFDPVIIANCTMPAFNTADKTPEEHTIRMLKEIRGGIKKIVTPSTELSFKKLENDHIEIDGYETELLRTYFEKTFGESSCLFGEAHDTEDRTILTYCEKDTDIPIAGNELAVFRCLLRNFGRDVSFDKLYGAIRNRDNLLHEQYSRSIEMRITSKSQKTSVQSAVNELGEKLKKATGYRVFPKIIKSVRKIGYKLVI